MVAAEFASGLSTFKTMFDLAKGLKDINDAAVRNTAIIELQEKILAAQAQQTALVERVSDLEKEISRRNKWEAEQNRYELRDYGSGTYAYALKNEETPGEPGHRICAHCYQQETKSILQFMGSDSGQDKFYCPNCKTEFLLETYQIRNYD